MYVTCTHIRSTNNNCVLVYFIQQCIFIQFFHDNLYDLKINIFKYLTATTINNVILLICVFCTLKKNWRKKNLTVMCLYECLINNIKINQYLHVYTNSIFHIYMYIKNNQWKLKIKISNSLFKIEEIQPTLPTFVYGWWFLFDFIIPSIVFSNPTNYF